MKGSETRRVWVAAHNARADSAHRSALFRPDAPGNVQQADGAVNRAMSGLETTDFRQVLNHGEGLSLYADI